MLPESLPCLRCKTPMELGFIADATYGGNVQEKWAAGAAENSAWWGTLKSKGKELYPVSTLRCPKCGYLESYAQGRPEL